jgi:hypothetical protein
VVTSTSRSWNGWVNPAELHWQYTDRTVRFENDGQRIVAIEPGQEGSIFLLHNALNDLHPKVKKFVTALSITGDSMGAALAAGLSQAQVAAVLPGLKVKLGPLLRAVG